MTRKGPLKVAKTFIENEPEQFGVYAKRVPGGPFNGELLALCGDEKDAALFAAAPDLLKALKECLATIERGIVHIHETGKPSWYAFDHMESVIRSALAKAKGETP